MRLTFQRVSPIAKSGTGSSKSAKSFKSLSTGTLVFVRMFFCLFKFGSRLGPHPVSGQSRIFFKREGQRTLLFCATLIELKTKTMRGSIISDRFMGKLLFGSAG